MKMKKILVLVLGVVSCAVLTGCGKQESAQAPMDQPMVTEQTAAVPATAGVAVEPIAPVAASGSVAATAMTDVAVAAIEQVASTIEKPSNQQIQQALKNAGLYAGSIDGSLGPKTKKAIQEFQSQNGLNADGKVGPKTWAKLASHLGADSSAMVATEPIMPADVSATGTEASN
jgi:murein L,D-transpeptidase YcbB/YkuD